MNVKIKEGFLKELAVIVAEHPDYSMKELAEAAGISKATIHRVYETREHLLELISRETDENLKEILDVIEEKHDDYENWLSDIIHSHFIHIEYILFESSGLNSEACVYGRKYEKAMNAFWSKGKKEGIFSKEVKPEYLTEIFKSAICGAFQAIRKGMISQAEAEAAFDSLWITGILASN